MPTDKVTFLPGAQDRAPVEQVIDLLVARAAAKDWTVERRSLNYAVFTRPASVGHRIQISVAMINGELKASRVVELENAEAANTVLDWLDR